MNLNNPSQDEINHLRRLMASGQISPEDMSQMSGSFGSEQMPQPMPEQMPQQFEQPQNALKQMMNAVPGEGFQNLQRGQGVVQVGDGPIQRINSAPQSQMEFDMTRPIEIAGKGKGYYSKDGRSAIMGDGSQVMLGYNRAASQANQDRQMKIAKFEADNEHTKAQTAYSQEKLRQAGLPAASSNALTMTEVVDPKDSSKLLRVDARAYKGGSLGDAGVLGVSGKEPTSAKREETANNGRDGLVADLQLMRDQYAKLDDTKSIPSTANSGLTNIIARAQSSGAGQFVGGALGTEEQAARNEIQATKRRLLSSIKNITGASAQEMNSNVELKTWMDSLGDPSKILESNLGILDAIESKYIAAKDYKNKPEVAAPKNPNSLNLGSSSNSAAAKWLQENPNDPRAAAVRAKAGL